MRIATPFSGRSAPWTQRAASQQDDFWSWRETMYALAQRLRREDLEAIAARCYLELLRGGYTAVAEFLYLHRLRRSPAHWTPTAPSPPRPQRTGMALTLLPTLYQHAGFGARRADCRAAALRARHARSFSKTGRNCAAAIRPTAPVALGVAFHSLRAVEIDVISRVHEVLRADPLCRCVHIHVAEQPAEVEGCIRQYGSPPVALLAATRAVVVEVGAGPRDPRQRDRTRAVARLRRHAGAVPDDRSGSR